MQESLPHSISRRYQELENEIAQACVIAGRDRKEVSLIAVSKGQDFLAIQEAYDLGLRDFGENYGQEFLAKLKQSQAEDLKIRWHFIGGIQSNKINIISQADMVHSISSLRYAELIEKTALKPIQGFLQVNLSQTDGRPGFSPAEILALLSNPWPFRQLQLTGLMTILPLVPDKPNSYWFLQMAMLKAEVLKLGIVSKLDLSMGMSKDFQEAIIHGASYIRIGTKIFGERN